MSSRLHCFNSGGGSSNSLVEVICPTGVITPIVLADTNLNSKVEIEYGFAIDGSVDKMQVGRITVLFNMFSAEITSHEIEDSLALGVINDVVITALLAGSDLGIQVNNTSGEEIIFKYIIVNKFPIFFDTPVSNIIYDKNFLASDIDGVYETIIPNLGDPSINFSHIVGQGLVMDSVSGLSFASVYTLNLANDLNIFTELMNDTNNYKITLTHRRTGGAASVFQDFLNVYYTTPLGAIAKHLTPASLNYSADNNLGDIDYPFTETGSGVPNIGFVRMDIQINWPNTPVFTSSVLSRVQIEKL